MRVVFEISDGGDVQVTHSEGLGKSCESHFEELGQKLGVPVTPGNYLPDYYEESTASDVEEHRDAQI